VSTKIELWYGRARSWKLSPRRIRAEMIPPPGKQRIKIKTRPTHPAVKMKTQMP